MVFVVALRLLNSLKFQALILPWLFRIVNVKSNEIFTQDNNFDDTEI